MAVRGQTPAGLNPAVVVAAKIIVAETGVKVGVIVVVVGKELPVILAEGIVSDAAVLRLAEIRLRFIFDNFLASCPLALSSALYLQQQAKPLTRRMLGQELRQVDHFGSYACRNIYHRQNARRSEHATAEALDISGFRLADGRRISVLKGWPDAQYHPWLQALLTGGCGYYGNALGPDYNAAHANHFHLGMRGQGFCF
ncbi:extensin family protein [Klebsiella grimontii]